MLRIVTKDAKVRTKINNASGNDIIVTILKLYEVLMENGFEKKDIDNYINELLSIKEEMIKNVKNNSGR